MALQLLLLLLVGWAAKVPDTFHYHCVSQDIARVTPPSYQEYFHVTHSAPRSRHRNLGAETNNTFVRLTPIKLELLLRTG